MVRYPNVAVLVKPTQRLPQALEALADVLKKAGCEVFFDERAAEWLDGRVPGHSREELGRRCDLAVVLGGDGTMLSVARALAPFALPIVGVNAGRLGFITDLCLDDMAELLPAILRGEGKKDSRRMLSADVVREGRVIYSGLAVNDIGISHGRAGGMVEFAVYVNGRPMATQSADGVMCATSTGSTAYALAAGGPLLSPELDGLILVPVAPHTLSNRPIVLPGDAAVDLVLVDSRDAVAYFDMQEFVDLQAGDTLRIRSSDLRFEMLHPPGFDYYELLRRKLKWNYMPARSHADESGE